MRWIWITLIISGCCGSGSTEEKKPRYCVDTGGSSETKICCKTVKYRGSGNETVDLHDCAGAVSILGAVNVRVE